MGAEGSRSKYQEPVGVAVFRSMVRVLRVGQDGGGEGGEEGQNSEGERSMGPERWRKVRVGSCERVCRVWLR